MGMKVMEVGRLVMTVSFLVFVDRSRERKAFLYLHPFLYLIVF